MSLAQQGVLFLDALPESKWEVLDVPRQPLKVGNLTVSRAADSPPDPTRALLRRR